MAWLLPWDIQKQKKTISFRGLRPTDRPTRGSAQKCVNNITGLCYCQDRFTSIA